MKDFEKLVSAFLQIKPPEGGWHKAFKSEKRGEHNRVPYKTLATKAKRRAIQRNAMPKWVDRKEIEAIYKACYDKNTETGIQHNVDHIVPLCGKNVTGLHVPWNLQIITAEENRKKGNRL